MAAFQFFTPGPRLVDPATEVLANDLAILGGSAGPFSTIQLTGLLFESATDTIIAHAGGGRAVATPLTTECSRITVVASAGDSVMLPVSAVGLTLLVINHGANPMQVFGAGTDKVDDVPFATGVSQMNGSMVIYTCVTPGNWYTEGLATGYFSGFQTMSAVDGLVAHAGGGQGSATALTAMFNRVSTVATANDSSILPVSASGMNITVTNAGAASMNVFPQGTDVINALGAGAAFALASGKTAEFVCYTAGQWHCLLSA